MKKAFVLAARLLAGVLILLLSFVLLYAGSVAGLGLIPVNQKKASTEEPQIRIFVIDNGVHTDLVLPAQTRQINWRDYLPLQDFPGADPAFSYYAFGWGNRRFYTETPEWRDLNLEVALSAALGIGKSAMHVYALNQAPEPGRKEVPIQLSETQYKALVRYILSTFQRDKNGRFLLIKSQGYTNADNFYEARGRFSLLKTCNGWTNAGLKTAGIETVFWAPIPHFMMRKLRQQNP